MNRLQSLRGSSRAITWPVESLLFEGMRYPLFGLNQTLGGKVEDINSDFVSLAGRAFAANPIVYACEMARVNLFTEARFQWQKMRGGRPGDYWGNEQLRILERPWPGGTTGDLLKEMLTDADLAGIAFVARRPGPRLVRLRPDWTTMFFGSQNPETQIGDLDAEFLGAIYHPGGRYSGREPVALDYTEVAYFAPVPDPLGQYRGIPWLTPVVREVMGDFAASEHKLKFFEHGATPSIVISTNLTDLNRLREWIALFEQNHEGVTNAYRSLYLGAAMDAKVLGANMQQIDFKVVVGAGEVRIANAAGVPATVVGLSEGLAGSSLNAGNFASSMRRFADLTMRPLWRNVAGSLEQIIPPPSGSRLWYDDRDISALKDDMMDSAEVQAKNAQAIRQLIDAGFEPASVVDAVNAGDLKRLEHTGLYSVQLQPPMPERPEPEEPPLLPPGNGAAALLAPLLKED